jgi:competence protein ComEC
VDNSILNGILSIASDKAIKVNCRQAGMEEIIGPVTVRTIHPPADAMPGSTNESSLVMHFSYNHCSALLTGDLEKTGEAAVLSLPSNLRSDLLKVAHHGSRHGTSNDLLARTHSRWAIVSAGRNNPFGHPSPEALSRLLHNGVQPLLTLREGAITFETDGDRYAIKTYISGLLERGKLEKQEPGASPNRQ